MPFFTLFLLFEPILTLYTRFVMVIASKVRFFFSCGSGRINTVLPKDRMARFLAVELFGRRAFLAIHKLSEIVLRQGFAAAEAPRLEHISVLGMTFQR